MCTHTAARWRNTVNIAALLASFLITLCYLLYSAVPKFNTPVWQSSVDFLNEVPVPAVAIMVMHIDIGGTQMPISYSNSSGDRLADAILFDGFRGYPILEPRNVYEENFQLPVGNFTAVVVNASTARRSLDSPLGSSISISVNITCEYINTILLQLQL